MRPFAVSFAALVLACPLAAQSTVHVCVAADRAMRVEAGPSCPAGQSSYNLVLAGGGGGAPPGEDKSQTAQVAELKKTIDFMQKRIDGLTHDIAALAEEKTHPSGMKFMAPFEVVDKVGKTILRVRDDRHGMEMVNTAGQTVLWASALDQGGSFKTRSSVTFPEVVMGSVGTLGALIIRDAEDQDRAFVKLSNGQPAIGLTNSSHIEVASIGIQSANTAKGLLTLTGLFQIVSAAGVGMVSAGVNPSGVGEVRVGPRGGCVPLGPLRVADCIMGHQ